MLGWNFMVIILLTNTHKVFNKIINNHSKNFKRNPEQQYQYWNEHHPQLGNRLKRVNPEPPEKWSNEQKAGYLEIENKDRKVDWDIEAEPATEDWYIETSTTNVNIQDNVKKSVGGTRNQFPRIRSFRNPAKRQKQLDDETDQSVKQDTWIIHEEPGEAVRQEPGKIREGEPSWTKRQSVKRVTGGMHPVKRVIGEMHPVKRVTGGMPAVCVPVKKKVLKCRTIKYRGRGITYCWYEDEEDCYSLD